MSDQPLMPSEVRTKVLSQHREIEQMLSELQERAPSTNLYIKADKKLRYGDVKAVMLMAHEAKFNSVALIAEAPQKN